MRRALGLLALCCACGLQSVELAPQAGEVILLDAVPVRAQQRLASATDVKVEARLALSYPDDGCAIPANLGPIEFVFGDEKKPASMDATKPPKPGASAYELRIRAAESDLRLYTSQTRASVPAARWRALLAEGGELAITLRALDGMERVSEAPALRLSVLAPLRAEQISYWNDARAAAVATTLDGEPRDPGARYPSLEPWESRSTDGALVAQTELGVLSVRASGVVLPLAWGPTFHAAESDWSPDGSALLFATLATPVDGAPGPMMMPAPMTMRDPEPDTLMRASLRVSRLAASGAASPELLLTAMADDERLRSPVYSPDGLFIAFERLKSRDELGRLWLLRNDGSEASALSFKMGWSGEGGFPTWLASAAPDQHWLVFSQARAPFADKLPAESAQLWAVALRRVGEDLTLAGAPFWLPGQADGDHNRRALASPP